MVSLRASTKKSGLLAATTALLLSCYTTTILIASNSVQVQALSMMASSTSSSAAAAAKRVVVVGAGIQGTSVAYHLAQRGVKVTLLEAKAPASAASGKGGGFQARSWGDGSPTQQLHQLSFDMYEEMAPALGCQSYQKLLVLSVSAGFGR